MSKIKNGGLDQYGAEPFEQQQFRAAGVEGVNSLSSLYAQGRVNTVKQHASKYAIKKLDKKKTNNQTDRA